MGGQIKNRSKSKCTKKTVEQRTVDTNKAGKDTIVLFVGHFLSRYY